MVYVRVTPGSADLSRAAEAERFFRETLIPTLEQMPGFRGYIGGVDRTNARITAISMWDTERQARQMRADLDPAVLRQMGNLGMELGVSHVYEVIIEASSQTGELSAPG